MNKIFINQSLQGYSKGHSLLESSILISSDAKRNLMIMSDMSGSSMQNGFEEYITGYPIKEMNVYALAKTWNAPEMERPGCVWTHTLLINFSDLIKIDNFKNVKKLFKRPSNFNFSDYSEAIELDIDENYNETNFFIESRIKPDFVKEIIYQLYTNSKSSILIQSQNPLLLEDIILSLWIQQWPRLKRNFSFCTGAISARSLNNRLLDLQIVPYKNDRSLIEKENIIFIDPQNNEDIATNGIVELLYNDLFCPSKELKRYFKTYGADVREDRSSLIPLVEIFLYLHSNSQIIISEIIEMLSSNFPLPSDASTLKNHILNNRKDSIDMPYFKEEALLYELATTDYYNSFDFVNLEFANRFQVLFRKNRKSVFEVFYQLISSNINIQGEIVLKPIAEDITENDLELLNHYYRKLLLIFLDFNPKIAYFKKFWQVNKIEQKENLYTLIRVNNVDWNNVIRNLLDINYEIEKGVFLSIKYNVTWFVLNWLNNNNETVKLNMYWIEILKDNPNEVIEWIKVNSEINDQIFALIPLILNPNSDFLSNSENSVWLKLVSKKIELEYLDRIKFKAFILALSFKRSDNITIDLISYSFEDVYIAALNSNLDYNSWRFLEEHTKPLSYWQDWDKCKKLRNALIDKFQEFKWPKNYLDKIFSNDEVFAKMASKYNKSKGNKN